MCHINAFSEASSYIYMNIIAHFEQRVSLSKMCSAQVWYEQNTICNNKAINCELFNRCMQAILACCFWCSILHNECSAAGDIVSFIFE